jgi:hypothetical protein
LVCTACATKQESILKAKGHAENVEFASDVAQQGVIGFRATSVRVSRDENSSLQASCDLVGEGFAAKVVTPGIVNLPSYGKNTKPIQAKCLVDGKELSQTVKPSNLSADNHKANAIGAGILVGGIMGGAVAGSVNGEKAGDAYGFKAIKLKAD